MFTSAVGRSYYNIATILVKNTPSTATVTATKSFIPTTTTTNIIVRNIHNLKNGTPTQNIIHNNEQMKKKLSTVVAPNNNNNNNMNVIASAINNNHNKKSITILGEKTHLNMKPIGYWLLGVGSLVAGTVAVGGITRLTKSGLSITDWKLQGTMPPMNPMEWEAEFNRYKTFPEWQQRKSMTMEEFKTIFWWEWGHRMFGRFIGLSFLLPFSYFAIRGKIPRHVYPRLGLLFSLGGTQGLVGWWMVKSGLDMDPEQRKEIRVSPYRLATHLGMAFTTYSLLLWTGLELLNPREKMETMLSKTMKSLSSTTVSTSTVTKNNNINTLQAYQYIKKLKNKGIATFGIVFITAMSGAFVAGNDAGRAYNSWPKMNDDDWIPEEILEMKPLYRNFFENTCTVQFDHRLLAYTSTSVILALFGAARFGKAGQIWHLALPPQTKNALMATLGALSLQVTLGISTLLMYVPLPLAAAHQVGSLLLLTCTTISVHSLRNIVTVMGKQAVKNGQPVVTNVAKKVASP